MQSILCNSNAGNQNKNKSMKTFIRNTLAKEMGQEQEQNASGTNKRQKMRYTKRKQTPAVTVY